MIPQFSLVGSYTNRQERAAFVAEHFAGFLRGRVLDVGCGDAWLKRYVADYTGVDIGGQPDIVLDLEKERLPFEDGAFDCVVCIDVLEHLDNLPTVFGELRRVSRGYVIVSLPNMYEIVLRLKFLLGRGITKEYGLFPRNRHKWLLNFNQAREFIHKSLGDEWAIQQELAAQSKGKGLPGRLYTLGARWRPNLFALAYWAVLQKKA